MKLPANFGRVLSGFVLCTALLMLVLGLTFFSEHLQKTTFIFYWLTCFLLTGIAAIVALLDIALIRRRQRKEQSELISETLKERTDNPSENRR